MFIIYRRLHAATKVAHRAYCSLKSKAHELMQYRCPVGFGPSSKRWPRCPPHVPHTTSVRFMPCEWSGTSSTFPFEITSKKLGQPDPDSNFVSDEKSGVPHAAHTYVPASLFSSSSPVNGASVPFSRRILYCSGVSRFSQSASDMSLNRSLMLQTRLHFKKFDGARHIPCFDLIHTFAPQLLNEACFHFGCEGSRQFPRIYTDPLEC